jgi:penicillin-binding protein 1A
MFNTVSKLFKGVLRAVAILLTSIVVIVMVSGLALWFWTASHLPDVQVLLKIDPPKCKVELTSNTEKFTLPPWRIDALQAIESPNGLNPFAVPSLRMVGKLVKVALGFRIERFQNNASELLARQLSNDFLPNDHTIARIFKQLVLSDLIELKLSDDDIATALLNHSYFGQHATGLDCAAATRYNSTVEKLTLAQFAMLIGLLKAPTNYDPIKRPIEARERRNKVLDIWYERAITSQADTEAAKLEPL